jgi:hypothetical protein
MGNNGKRVKKQSQYLKKSSPQPVEQFESILIPIIL